MSGGWEWGYVAAEVAAAGLLVAALLRLGMIRLDSSLGRLRDGLPPGARAPSVTTKAGHEFPRKARWNALVFADHSLSEWPGVIEAMRALALDPDWEVAILCRHPNPLAEQYLAELGVGDLVQRVTDAEYRAYNVHVSPFATCVDPEGRISQTGIVNTYEGLLELSRASSVVRTLLDTMQESPA